MPRVADEPSMPAEGEFAMRKQCLTLHRTHHGWQRGQRMGLGSKSAMQIAVSAGLATRLRSAKSNRVKQQLRSGE